MSRRLPALVLAAVAALALVAVVLVSVLGGDDAPTPDARTTTPVPTPTATPAVPLDDVDTLTTAVTRAGFCDAVAPEEVEAALGGPPTETTSYADGQAAQLTGQVRDISHEFACGWTSATGNVRAWVFAPPVTRRDALGLVRTARQEQGCRADDTAPAFGAPTVALVCPTKRGLQVSFRGLFGDAWLTCTVAGSFERPEAMERADRWCSAVLAATATAP